MSTGNLVNVVFVNCESTSACMVGLQNMEPEICSRFYVRLRGADSTGGGFGIVISGGIEKNSFFQRVSTAATLKRMMR